jgi:hypothetical protein
MTPPRDWRINEVRVCPDCGENFWPTKNTKWASWVSKTRCDRCSPVHCGRLGKLKQMKQSVTTR